MLKAITNLLPYSRKELFKGFQRKKAAFKSVLTPLNLFFDQPHIMTNYPTNYESFWTNKLRGVAFTKYNYIEIA